MTDTTLDLTRGQMVVRSESFAGNKLNYQLIGENTGNEKYPVTYGVRVETSLFGSLQDVQIGDITVNKAYAEELFSLLVTYLVTPISLKDVIEDFLYEKYSC